MKIGVVGLGKLGLPIALSLATKHDVVGYDVFPNAREILDSKKYPHREVGAQELLEDTTLKVVGSVDEAVAHAHVVFVIVQTPHRPEFEGVTRLPEERADFDYTFLKQAVSEVATAAQTQEKKIVMAVMSTVLPGTVDREVKPLLNKWAALCYVPAFPAMGSAVEDFLHPEFVLLGVDDPDAADVLHEVYAPVVDAPIVEMSVASAEATKVFYNSFISAKIALANTWMEMCERLGANVDDVSRALSLATSRVISPKYLRGGLGDAGGCLIAGELIYGADGVVAIEDVTAGDSVLGSDGFLHEVEETYKRPYKGTVYRIKARGNATCAFTPEHPVHVARDLRPRYQTGGTEHRNNKSGSQPGPIEALAASALDDDFYAVFPIPKDLSHRESDIKNDLAEFGGYYLGDGCLIFDSKSRVAKTVKVTLNTTTKVQFVEGIVASAKRILPNLNPKISRDDSRHAIIIECHSREFCRVIDDEFGHGAEHKQIPAWGRYGREDHALALLKGLFRTDGSNHDRGFSYTTISPQLAHGVSMILRRFGVASSLTEKPRLKPDGTPHRLGYQVAVTNAIYVEKLAALLEVVEARDMEGRRFSGTCFVRDGFYYHKIESVTEEQYEGTVYNLNVKDTHNYVTAVGSVDNCHPRDNIALSWLSRKLEMGYDLFGDIMHVREAQTDWLAVRCIDAARRRNLQQIVILGKAYKAGTNLTVGSCATLLANILAEHPWVKYAKHEVTQWDPHVDPPRTFGEAAVFVVATNHDEFYSMTFPTNSVIVDPWGAMPDLGSCEVIRIGRS